MTYPGTDLKFRITTTQPDFNLSEDTFEIKIKDQYNRVRQVVTKSDCFWDDQGGWYFVMDDVKTGIYFAWFHGRYEDEDYDDQRRDFRDIQELCRVGYCGCKCGCKCKHVVQYEQVWTVSIDGDEYLCDCDGKYILTADNKRICFKNPKAQQIEDMGKVRLDTLTGEQFKKLVETFEPNSEVDTIPELMHAMQGISDDKTVRDDVQQQIDEHDTENEAQDSDIDSIFDQGASTAPTVPTQPLVVEEEEEP